jgi:23S rRNA pseudouridine1911/1915/1917 synthase
METTSIIISDEENMERIDKILASRFTDHSRTYFQYLIENEFVFLNGKKPKKRHLLKTGDEINVFFQLSPEIELEPEQIELDILYEDEHIIAINKPYNFVVHPAVGNRSHTFVNALLYHCKNLAPGFDPIRPGIVHRLDKDTTGVLIAAKTEIAHRKLIDQFSCRSIEKNYLTICVGKPSSLSTNAPIKRHPNKRKEMTVDESGKASKTDFDILAYNEELSLVMAKPKTGRTHQIRVHLKHLKAPILGDAVYGSLSMNKKFNVKRQLLHAYQLKFTHPITKEKFKITAPIPDDLKKFMHFTAKSDTKFLKL